MMHYLYQNNIYVGGVNMFLQREKNDEVGIKKKLPYIPMGYDVTNNYTFELHKKIWFK